MKVGSLFTGYGGLEMGVQKAFPDADVRWVSEIEPSKMQIINARFPGIPNIGDITSVDWTQIEPVDLLAGGSPCQDLSHAGARKGMNETTRSGLWFSMLEGIRYLKPTYVVWENVRGALSARASSNVEWQQGLLDERSESEKPARENDHTLRALGRVLGDLHEAGYDAAWTTFRAGSLRTDDWDHVGAPHQRERVFVLGKLAADPLCSGGGGGGRSPEPYPGEGRKSYVKTVGTDYRSGSAGEPRLTLLPTPTTRDHKGHNQRRDDTCLTGALLPTPVADNSSGIPSASTSFQSLANEAVSAATDFGKYSSAIARWESVTGAPPPHPTEKNRKGNPVLSPKFVEWMMGVPAGWVTDIDISRRFQLKALGDGVIPLQAGVALTYLKEVLERT